MARTTSTRTGECEVCGGCFEQSGSGPLRLYCDEAECRAEAARRRRRRYVRGTGRNRHRVLERERKRAARHAERQQGPRLVCGCGRDYMTVELGEHECPNLILIR